MKIHYFRAWRALCQYWEDHGGIAKNFAYAIASRCNWVVTCVTMKDMFPIAKILCKLQRKPDETEETILILNENLLSKWELPHGAMGLDDDNGNVWFYFRKEGIRVEFEVDKKGNVSLHFFTSNHDKQRYTLDADTVDFFYVLMQTGSLEYANNKDYIQMLIDQEGGEQPRTEQ